MAYLPPHERLLTLPISARASIPKHPRGTECIKCNFPVQVSQKSNTGKILMSQGRKKASKLQSMISFSRDLTDIWLKSRKRLPFSAGVRTLPRIPALPAQKSGGREAHFTSSNQMFNVEGSLPSFPSQTATTQKWLRGPIYYSQVA